MSRIALLLLLAGCVKDGGAPPGEPAPVLPADSLGVPVERTPEAALLDSLPSAPPADSVRCVAAPEGVEAYVQANPSEARVRFVAPHRAVWRWGGWKGEGGQRYGWEAKVRSGEARYRFGFSLWDLERRPARSGSLEELVRTGQSSVWELWTPPQEEGFPPMPEDAGGARVVQGLKVESSARGDTVFLAVRDAETFERLFASRPDSLTLAATLDGEEAERKVALVWLDVPVCTGTPDLRTEF